MSIRTYRIWHENGDLEVAYSSEETDLYASPAQVAEDTLSRRRSTCQCGEEAGPEGLFCGVLHPHGYSLQVVEDGEDVTQDYLING